jgi:hypothetical protein
MRGSTCTRCPRGPAVVVGPRGVSGFRLHGGASQSAPAVRPSCVRVGPMRCAALRSYAVRGSLAVAGLRRYASRCGRPPGIGATGFEPATFRPARMRGRQGLGEVSGIEGTRTALSCSPPRRRTSHPCSGMPLPGRCLKSVPADPRLNVMVHRWSTRPRLQHARAVTPTVRFRVVSRQFGADARGGLRALRARRRLGKPTVGGRRPPDRALWPSTAVGSG